MSRLAKRGDIVRLAHGLYQHSEANIDPIVIEFSIACNKLGPNSLIGGLSALYHYVLTDQAPHQTWVMVPHSIKNTFPKYKLIRTNHDPTIEVEEHDTYRIATIERAIIEAFSYASKIGFSVALTAARTALKEGKISEKSLYNAAKRLDLWKNITPHWEAIIAK